MIRIDLPLPPSTLGGNSRAHWRTRHKDAKAYKELCYCLLREHAPKTPYERVTVRYEWHSTHHTEGL